MRTVVTQVVQLVVHVHVADGRVCVPVVAQHGGRASRGQTPVGAALLLVQTVVRVLVVLVMVHGRR